MELLVLALPFATTAVMFAFKWLGGVAAFENGAESKPLLRLTVRAASAKAGLIHLPSRAAAMKREWKKANNAQRAEFLKWVRSIAPKGAAKPIANPGGQLRPDVRAFLQHWIISHRSKAGRIMKEIGFSTFDWTLHAAIVRGEELRPAVIPKLSAWLTKQGFRE